MNTNETTVLFDLDGTLVNSLPLIKHTYFKVFKDMGINWGNDDVMKWIGRTLKDIAVHFAGEEQAEQFIENYQRHYYCEHDKYITLFPGTSAMLDRLKRKGIKIGVVTSKGRPGTMKALEFTGIAKYMDVVVTAQDVIKHKPFPEPVLKALEILGAGRSGAFYIGDSGFDIEAGNAAGVRSLGVTWGICTADELIAYKPFGILDKWADLENYL